MSWNLWPSCKALLWSQTIVTTIKRFKLIYPNLLYLIIERLKKFLICIVNHHIDFGPATQHHESGFVETNRPENDSFKCY